MDGWIAFLEALGAFMREVVAALANPQVILGLFLVSWMVFQSAMLMRASRDKSKTFDLLDVIRGPDQRVQAAKVVQMVCLEACVWAFVLYAIQTKLDALGIWWFAMLLVGIGSPVVNKLADGVVSKWAGLPPDPVAPPPPAPTVKVTQTDDSTVTEVKR